MSYTLHAYQQGTDAWHQHRARALNASEAPVIMGASKYTTRQQLLQQKHTGIAPEVSSHQQALFDRGHAAEAGARPLVEELIGDELAPVTASIEIDGLLLSASYDGLTLLADTAFEHKLWSEDLAAQVRAGELEPHYYWQLEHQLLVVGAERVIFVCSDGTREKFASMEYLPQPGRREQLLAGWRQFAADLAAYTPPAAAEPAPTGRAPDTLPALRIEITGAVTASNLAEFKATALGAIQSVNRSLATDQDFADAEQAVKWCGEVESRIKAAKEHALSQTASIEELFRTLDDVSAEARRVRLDLEKLVERRKVEIKGEMVAAAKSAYDRHVAALQAECGAWRLLSSPDFGSAIKNKRNVQSMQDALDTALANGKIQADEQARTIRAALAALSEESKGFEHLFRDTMTFFMLPPDIVRQMVRGRIAEHQAAEQRRAAELAEQERERIRAEEQAKAEREAREKLEAEQREAAQRAAASAPSPTPAPVEIAAPAPASQASSVVPMPSRSGPPTLKLGQINERIAPLSITADGLARLGFPAVAKERAACLYQEHDFPRMCDSIVAHVRMAQQDRAAA